MDGDTRLSDEHELNKGDTTLERPQKDVVAQPADTLTLGTSTLAIWLAIVVALVGFVLLARVSVHPDGFDRTMRVVDVWTTMADDLPDVSRQIVLKTIFYVSIGVTLLGVFAAILIALAARDPLATTPMHDRSARQDGGAEQHAAGIGD